MSKHPYRETPVAAHVCYSSRSADCGEFYTRPMLFRRSKTGRIRPVRWFVLSVVCAATAISQETKSLAPDSASYLEAEHNVRHEFLQRYPLTDQMAAPVTRLDGQNKAALAAMKTFEKIMEQQPDEKKFALDFAFFMQGKVEAKKVNAKRPSYWQRQLAGLMVGLPFGDAMSKSYLAQNQTKAAIANEEAPSRLAFENMQNFRTLVIGYDIATGEEFDHAAPLAKTRLIFTMFSKVQQDISLACPFSIYLLDIDESRANEPGVTPVARGLVGHLLGKSSPEYQHFPEYSREQKSGALKKASLQLLGEAQNVATVPTVENLKNYLLTFAYSTEQAGRTVQDDQGRFHPFSELMRTTFGDAELQKFDSEPEGPEKNVDRIAVILLWTQFRLGSSGWLIG